MERLLAWYDKHARDLPWRQTRDPYRIWISEIMLQQTRVEAVRGYYSRFLEALPTVEALAAVDESILLKLWEGLGYYSRARNLKRAAEQIVSEYGGSLPQNYDTLLHLPGIGTYTAGAIASIAFDVRVPAVDGNVLRVMSRLNDDEADILDPAQKKKVHRKLLESMPQRAGTFNQAMMDLGATVCVPNGAPHCDVCPLQKDCAALQAGRERMLPVKRGKKARRIENKTVFVLTCTDESGTRSHLGYRREETGLLASLWQLPDTEGHLSVKQMTEQLAVWGMQPNGEWRIYDRKHIFTHVEWHMRVCALDVLVPALPSGWTVLDETVHSLPTAYRVCL